MFAEVVAVPPEAPDTMRPGARFTLREGAPLRVGRSSRCRLQVEVPAGQDLLVGIRHGSPHAWTEAGLPLPVSLSGRTIDMEVSYPLVDGDHLVFSTGLVLALREQPLVVARDEHLELALADAPDDPQALAVYLDFLEERGDPMRRWLTSEHRGVEAERFFMLGPLSESARTQAVQTTFDARGFLSHVTVARHGLVGTPGLYWHLDLLGRLPVARLLEHLTIELVVGTAAKSIVAPRGTPGWPKTPPADLVVARALEAVARAGFAKTLRTLSFGVGTVDVALPRVPRGAFPRLRDGSLVTSPMRAQLTLVSEPVEGLLAPASVGWTFALTSEVRVGSDERAHLRVRDTAAPALACRFVRREEGWLVLAEASDAETHHPRLRVNGRETTRRVLSAGDEVEPVPGLVLRFALLPR
ncbi:MAG: hypothetical protein SFW67_03895 [Myxococcaceae bacterium]|nr:hypothetical protein [Myxococcaceae bacterium]